MCVCDSVGETEGAEAGGEVAAGTRGGVRGFTRQRRQPQDLRGSQAARTALSPSFLLSVLCNYFVSLLLKYFMVV